MKALAYKLNRFLLRFIARPTITGIDNLSSSLEETSLEQTAPAEIVYVLHHRAVTDLIMLDLVCSEAEITSPFAALQCAEFAEHSRFFSLYRSKAGRMTMPARSQRLQRLIQAPAELKERTYLVPVSIFWGRAMSSEGSILKNLTSEHWAVTGRFKRILNLIINRKNIYVHTGRPIRLADVCRDDEDDSIAMRRAARLLRVRLRQQKETALGPDFSHRRTLLNQLVTARAVRDVIDQQSEEGLKPAKLERLALKYARTLASDMSHPTIRVLARLLRWFWNKIYDGIELNGLTDLEEVSATHTLVYVPSHRSHLDYLLLSYLLYYHGFMIPHIAAGDNLNLPVVGGLLRRGGAFFMRRSFRDNPLYAAVFNEYLYQVYRRGHCLEFFPEGGRTRTGRLLPARLGLLRMTVEHQQRGLPKPIAFIPVYFGYEKLVEGASYLSELRGADKKTESIGDVFRNFKLIRQNFGSVAVNFGTAIKLDEWLGQHREQDSDTQVRHLGQEIMVGINNQASLNAVNLVALVTLATPKVAIEEHRLEQQITCYQHLVRHLFAEQKIRVCEQPAKEIIAHVEALGMLHRDNESFGAVLDHDPFNAVMMTWYRNNVAHVLALPSLIACLMVKRRRSISAERLQGMIRLIYPYLAIELSCDSDLSQISDALAIMTTLKLLDFEGGQYSAPGPVQPEHLQLTLLANLVSQTLERMFIVIYQLAQGPVKREELRNSSQLVAQRISRLYGINAPEFSDQRLFDQFIDGLRQQGILYAVEDNIENPEEELLTYDPIIQKVLRAAAVVIDPQIRHSVLSASNHR